ncbi:MAG: 2-amino-4-hydroxy-6-hydroxymethyldihydropteridine diphosphokinase [Pseudomonadales bacterium]
MVWVLVGLGSNRGDSVAIVREALDRLQDFAAAGVRGSSLWRTSPVDCPPGSGDFINAAAAFEPRPGVSPEALLAGLKAIERDYGRQPVGVRNAPRELDLDLLLFGDEVRQADDFVLPHPRAVNRLFVLAPAAEVLPQARWPGTGRSVAELLAALHSDECVERLPEPRASAGRHE